jgi:hypothetical protein
VVVKHVISFVDSFWFLPLHMSLVCLSCSAALVSDASNAEAFNLYLVVEGGKLIRVHPTIVLLVLLVLSLQHRPHQGPSLITKRSKMLETVRFRNNFDHDF